jgi:hypothetical protein
MEPVLLPKVVAPVTPTDRVKRAKPREDKDGGSAFARYLRQNKDRPAEEPAAVPEEPGRPTEPPDPESEEESGRRPTQKLIDIRV